MDHQPGSGVRAEQSARDRLIRLATSHPTWALGFQDEVWWSRLAAPALHSWAETDRPLQLVEHTVAKDDLDPKALACYGLLVHWAEPDHGRHEEAWLRFVDGRPVSAITTQYLAWCCTKLEAAGKEALLLVWDNERPLAREQGGPCLDPGAQLSGQTGGQWGAHRQLLPAHQEPLAEPDRGQVGPRQEAPRRRARPAAACPPVDPTGVRRLRLRA
jgi:hypothetical protein